MIWVKFRIYLSWRSSAGNTVKKKTCVFLFVKLYNNYEKYTKTVFETTEIPKSVPPPLKNSENLLLTKFKKEFRKINFDQLPVVFENVFELILQFYNQFCQIGISFFLMLSFAGTYFNIQETCLTSKHTKLTGLILFSYNCV